MMRVCLRLRAAAALLALLAISGPAGAQDGVETSVAPPRVTPPTGGSPNGGTILVTKRPVQVLAGPSLSAAVLYGFPAGRPFRLIGRDAGFAQIQDLKSSATGWIGGCARPAIARANCPVSRNFAGTGNRASATGRNSKAGTR